MFARGSTSASTLGWRGPGVEDRRAGLDVVRRPQRPRHVSRRSAARRRAPGPQRPMRRIAGRPLFAAIDAPVPVQQRDDGPARRVRRTSATPSGIRAAERRTRARSRHDVLRVQRPGRVPRRTIVGAREVYDLAATARAAAGEPQRGIVALGSRSARRAPAHRGSRLAQPEYYDSARPPGRRARGQVICGQQPIARGGGRPVTVTKRSAVTMSGPLAARRLQL